MQRSSLKLGKLVRRCMHSGVEGVHNHTSHTSAKPLISHYRTRWPMPRPSPAAEKEAQFVRTIPDEKINFQMKATFDHGSSIFYPHLKYHPSDYKVGLVVNVDDIGLNDDEKAIFVEMAGPRFNQGKREVRLTAEKFANRLENKKYATLVVEKLLAECRTLAKLPDKYL